MAASSAALRRAASSFSRCHPIHPHVRCDRAQWSGVSKQKLPHALERAHVPGGKGAGGGSDAQTEGRERGGMHTSWSSFLTCSVRVASSRRFASSSAFCCASVSFLIFCSWRQRACHSGPSSLMACCTDTRRNVSLSSILYSSFMSSATCGSSSASLHSSLICPMLDAAQSSIQRSMFQAYSGRYSSANCWK